jgi:hypothetical protein
VDRSWLKTPQKSDRPHAPLDIERQRTRHLEPTSAWPLRRQLGGCHAG